MKMMISSQRAGSPGKEGSLLMLLLEKVWAVIQSSVSFESAGYIRNVGKLSEVKYRGIIS